VRVHVPPTSRKTWAAPVHSDGVSSQVAPTSAAVPSAEMATD
jgi:hypothetical protein